MATLRPVLSRAALRNLPALTEVLRRSQAIEVAAIGAVVIAVAALHLQLGRARETIWIFPDELIRVAGARRVAETGVHRVDGVVTPIEALMSYLLAPAWIVFDGGAALTAAHVLIVMVLATTPAAVYLLVRGVTSRPAALLTACAAGLVPAGWYSVTFMTEAVGIAVVVWFALALHRVLLGGGIGWWLALGMFALAGVAVRGQLAVLPLVAGAALIAAAAHPALRSAGQRKLSLVAVGLIAIGCLALVAFRGVSDIALAVEATVTDPGGVVWAVQSPLAGLTAAMWAIPAVALFALPGELRRRDADVRRWTLALVITTLAGALVAYTVGKSLLISHVADQGGVGRFAAETRNVVYLEPLMIVALIIVVGRTSWVRAWMAGALAVLLLISAQFTVTPIHSGAPGLSWFWHADPGAPEVAGWIPVVLVALALLGGLALWRSIIPPAAAVSAVGALMVVSLVYAYDGDRALSAGVAATQLGEPADWVDRRVGDERVALLIPASADLSVARSLLAWNSSIGEVQGGEGRRWRMPTPMKVLPSGGDLGLGDGVRWLVTPPGYLTSAQASVVEPRTGLVLSRVSGPTSHLASIEGRYQDGWVGADADVRRAVPGPAGVARVAIDTTNAFVDSPRTVTWRVGADSGRTIVPPGVTRGLEIPVPEGPFRLDLRFAPAPSPIDAGGSDPRELSLVLGPVELPGVEAAL